MQLRPAPRLIASLAVVVFSLSTIAIAQRPAAPAADSVRDLAMATPESVGVSSERLKRLDAAIKKMVDTGKLAGAVTMLTRRGKTVSVTVNGKKDIRKPDLLDKDSIFRIYSMTKPVTGVAMMMLFEEGLWRLDDPVSKFVPEFARLQVYVGENADGTLKTESRATLDHDARADDTHGRTGLRPERRQPGAGEPVSNGTFWWWGMPAAGSSSIRSPISHSSA